MKGMSRWYFLCGSLLTLLPVLSGATDVLDIKFGEQCEARWELGNEVDEYGYFLYEFVPPGQSASRSSKMYTTEGLACSVKPHRITLHLRAKNLGKAIRDRCPNALFSILWQREDRVIYKWRIFRCPGEYDQAEIGAYIAGNSTLWRVAYTKSTSTGLEAGESNCWERALLGAEVLDVP